MHQPLAPLIKQSGYGTLHTFCEPKLDCIVIIALHAHKGGTTDDAMRHPTIGGCRFQTYPSYYDALVDAIRLGQGMSDKAKVHGLDHAGGTAVMLQTPTMLQKRRETFEFLGTCIHSLGGSFIAATDIGTTQADMDIIAKKTPHVIASAHCSHLNNTAMYTALGVVESMKAALMHLDQKADFKDVHVAIQGVGASGLKLCKYLTEKGAEVTVTDLDLHRSKIAKERYGANIVSIHDIHKISCDVFAPCAHSNVINNHTLPSIRARIIVGTANNICDDPQKQSQALFEKGILYVPDFISNGGGLIHASIAINQGDDQQTMMHIAKMYHTTYDLLANAAQNGISPWQMCQNHTVMAHQD